MEKNTQNLKLSLRIIKSNDGFKRNSENRHILLVEDDRLVQKVHRTMIERAGYSVDIASTGKEALACYKPEKYVIVFLDAGLPDTTGFALAKIIRDQESFGQHQPLVMLSAYTYDEVKKECELAGIDEFAIKPVHIEALHGILKRFLEAS